MKPLIASYRTEEDKTVLNDELICQAMGSSLTKEHSESQEEVPNGGANKPNNGIIIVVGNKPNSIFLFTQLMHEIMIFNIL